MDLPRSIPNARVLIAVKTYPQPSSKYEELVCTAGILLDYKKWVRIYPIPFRALPYESQYKKYDVVELDLERRDQDFRPESYRPRQGRDESFKAIDKIGTSSNWAERKGYVLQDSVFSSMNELIADSKKPNSKSLATLKPSEIISFEIEEESEREWEPEQKKEMEQGGLFDSVNEKNSRDLRVVRRLPYKYSYKFLSEGDTKPHKLMVEDWEIGALYWKMLSRHNGNEEEANKKIRQKYWDEFQEKTDLYFFVGTRLTAHARNWGNPFSIIGLFYPPKPKGNAEQLSLLA